LRDPTFSRFSIEHRLVTYRQTHDDGIYRAIMASPGKNYKWLWSKEINVQQ